MSDIKNGVIDKITFLLLRCGNCDFTEDGSFDPDTEAQYPGCPDDCFLLNDPFNPDSPQVTAYIDGAWTTVDREFIVAQINENLAANIENSQMTLGAYNTSNGDKYNFIILESLDGIPTCNLDDNVTKASNYIYRSSGTDVPITDGGTGASTAAVARTNLGLNVNSNRAFTTQSSPAFSTTYTPSSTQDTLVTAIVQMVCGITQTATINAQINTGSGMVTRASASCSNNLTILGLGGSLTEIQTLTFLVPANSSFQLTSSGGGTPSISSINYLSM